MRFIVFAVVIYSFCGLYCFGQENTSYGLGFKSHLSNLDERTSLALNADKPFSSLKEGFSISFDLKLREEEQMFGYVFRMLCGEESSFDLLTNFKDSEFNFIINNGKNQIVYSKKYENKALVQVNKWLVIKIQFFRNKTKVLINDIPIELEKGIEKFEDIRFYFGANKTKHFYTKEVPPFVVRNIKIEESDKLIRHWVMKYHNDTAVYDEVSGHVAIVENGVWEIDAHTKWSKVFSLGMKDLPQIAYDDRGGRIFVVGDNKVFEYTTKTGRMDSLAVRGGNPYQGLSRQIIYDKKHDELLSYSVQSNQMSRYSFQTNRWSESPTIYVDSRQHHNHILDEGTNALYLLNGYAYHQYNGDIIKLGLTAGSEWERVEYNPKIEPRYLSATAQVDSTHVLLLGGFGSKSGRQEEFPRNYYDLYKINYRTGAMKKLWDLNLDTSIVFSNSMFVDDKENRLYVLGYSNIMYKSTVSLYSVDINSATPKLKVYETTIPFNFLDIESFCDLFYDMTTQKLYALVSYKNTDGRFEVVVYSIGYPVFISSEIRQVHSSGIGWYFVLIGGLIVVGIGFWLMRKKSIPLVTDLVEIPDEVTVAVVEVAVEKEISVQRDELVIELFNGFELIDRQGNRCSASFTPILKNIFLCILLNTIKNNERGITSYDLNQAFWQGMSSDKALNNRSVNMRKLRVLLSSIGKIEIIHSNSHWKLSVQEDYVCDYQLVMDLLKMIENDGRCSVDRIQKIIGLVKGRLLPGIENEWVDSFKSEFTSLLILVLSKALSSDELKGNDNLKLQIADVILINDSLEEKAIIFKCHLLYKLGQQGQSKRAFDKYSQEYEAMLGSKLELTYQEVIEMSSRMV